MREKGRAGICSYMLESHILLIICLFLQEFCHQLRYRIWELGVVFTDMVSACHMIYMCNYEDSNFELFGKRLLSKRGICPPLVLMCLITFLRVLYTHIVCTAKPTIDWKSSLSQANVVCIHSTVVNSIILTLVFTMHFSSPTESVVPCYLLWY